jgi:Tfp pilus assembly protein PilN
MKIELNLAAAPSFRDRYGLCWAVPLAVGAFLMLAYLAVAAFRDIREYRMFNATRATYQSQLSQLRSREMSLRRSLEQPQYRQIVHEVNFVNSLIDQRQLSGVALLERIARLLPPRVRLASLTFSQPNGRAMITLGIQGDSQESVEQFVSNLEDSPDFSDVTVLQNGFESKGGPTAPLSITCTAVYSPGQVAQGQASGAIRETTTGRQQHGAATAVK